MKTITPQEFDPQSATLIDVRSLDEYSREHIAGSINVPLETLASAYETLKVYPNIVISCQSGKRAEQAYHLLSQMGLTNLSCLEGALNGWKRCGKPTQSFKSGISIMRQVQLIVGSMVLAGVFVKPLWFLAAIAGCGMALAGLTNTCMLAVILGKMPWNRTNTGSSCSLSSSN